MTTCYIFDIDGTLADCTHRLHHIEGEEKNWDAFFSECHADQPIPHIMELARLIENYSLTHVVVFVSGRSSACRQLTEQWLRGQRLMGPLFMRSEGDHRPDEIVKKELLQDLISEGFEPICVLDDRATVVKMWRENGLPCLQVAEGDF